ELMPPEFIPGKSQEFYKGQRRKEKTELFKRYRLRVIINHYKQKFFNCFENLCFKCKTENSLVIDHHIPMSLGGHLVPGNIVALCKKCNGQKWDLPPEKFYSAKELKELQLLLIKEKEIFEFQFNWDYWNRDREGYLLSLGIDRKLVHQVLTDKNHIDYIEESNSDLRINLNLSGLSKFKKTIE
ncbi:HNH endonuclease, partial [Leptospira sp. 201903071]|uniref:HNH endonuclease n=1 Tax=Leptospira ainazelensis TaxID=2810034 RepID=UPI0019661A8F